MTNSVDRGGTVTAPVYRTPYSSFYLACSLRIFHELARAIIHSRDAIESNVYFTLFLRKQSARKDNDKIKHRASPKCSRVGSVVLLQADLFLPLFLDTRPDGGDERPAP